MNATYTVTLAFSDPNMPKMIQRHTTEDAAQATGSHWLKQFASVKSITITDPAGCKTVYNGRGVYLFTVPPLK